jgi:hypothetical protein
MQDPPELIVEMFGCSGKRVLTVYASKTFAVELRNLAAA